MDSVSLVKNYNNDYNYYNGAKYPGRDDNNINIFNNILPGDYTLEISCNDSYSITIDDVKYSLNIYINYDETEKFHIDRNGIIQVKVDHYESMVSPLITASLFPMPQDTQQEPEEE